VNASTFSFLSDPLIIDLFCFFVKGFDKNSEG
jgi:hypothetical protein